MLYVRSEGTQTNNMGLAEKEAAKLTRNQPIYFWKCTNKQRLKKEAAGTCR